MNAESVGNGTRYSDQKPWFPCVCRLLSDGIDQSRLSEHKLHAGKQFKGSATISECIR